MGMLAAMCMWYKCDHDAEQRQRSTWVQSIGNAGKDVPWMTTHIEMPTDDLSNRAPTITLRWDAAKAGITGSELVAKLDAGTPRIFVMGGSGKRPNDMSSSTGIMPYMKQPGDYKLVPDALAQTFRSLGHFEKSSSAHRATGASWRAHGT